MTKPVVKGKRDNFALARGYVRQNAPYFSPTLYAFVPTPYEGLTAAAGGPLAVTDRLVLLYEPDWVASIEMEILATGLAHEVMHDTLRHIPRSLSYPNKERYNLAGDLFINGLMAKQMRRMRGDKGGQVQAPLWVFPDWAAMPAKYGFPDGLTADEYYRLLEEKEKKEKKDSCAGGGEAGTNQPKFMCGACGGVAGNPGLAELEKKFNQLKGRSEAECKTIARATSQGIKTHMLQEGRGTSPGEWSELFDIGEEVYTVPWNEKLASITRYSLNNVRTGGLDYSLRRPSGRSYMRGWPLPGIIGYDPEVAVIVDSSGSMGKEQIGSALRVTADVMEQTGISSVWFMEADAGVQRDPVRVSPHELRSLELSGRGGTNFTPAIEYMQSFQPRVSLVLYFTDGDGDAPAEAPQEFELIWGVVPSPYQKKPAEWGHLIMLSDYLEGATAEDFNDEE